MLTRLEIDGFKNLLGVELEFGPFTCIAGPNGVGKSNLFDAIQFLSLLAQHKIMDAARRVRGSEDDPTNPRDLFHRSDEQGEQPARMRFAAEMIVPDEVRDTFGRTAEPTITFLRYELELVYEPPTAAERYGRVRLAYESLVHINQSAAARHVRWPHAAGAFRRRVVKGARRGGAFISTKMDADGTTKIETHQDGGSRGKPRPSAAREATATTIGATSSVDDPTIFAVKEEMIGWKLLALEPSAMRRPDKYWDAGDSTSVAENGLHILGTLWSLEETDAGREQVCDQVAAVLSDLLPVRQIRVVPNDANQQYELELLEPRGPWLGARSLSEGTLRFLALATLSVDPTAARLVCMEEPENGIHPLRMPAMLDLLLAIAVNPFEEPTSFNPVRQVIVNTHSPRLVQELEARKRPEDLLIAESAVVRRGGKLARTLRFRHRRGSWRASAADPGVGRGIAIDYLTLPSGSQGSLWVADA